MVSARTLLLLALSAKVSGQAVPELSGASSATEATIVVPPADVLCPSMTPFAAGIYLHTETWSFMRTVHVMQKATIPGGTDRRLGTVSTAFASWNIEYQLKDPINHQLISKLVLPGAFWDTAQDVYDCKGYKMASVNFDFDWKDIFSNRYKTHQVLDSDGNHVADLRQEEVTTGKGNLGSAQHYIYLQDTTGTALAAMRHPGGGWKVGPFGEDMDVQIELLSMNMLAPKPAMDPEFLSLVFANALASGSKFGPGWGLIFAGIFFVVSLFGLFCCICGTRKKEEKGKTLEEGQGLLSTQVVPSEEKVESKGRDIFSCCARRAGPTQSTVAPIK